MPDHIFASSVAVSTNPQKPHLAVDISVQIPDDFNRLSFNSFLSIQDINSPNRHLTATTKLLVPGADFTATLGGFSPATSYELKITLANDGENAFTDIVTFTTQPEPVDERKTLLMIIDYDLYSEELEHEYNLYIQSIIQQEGNIDVEKYYIGNDYDEKTALYEYIKESYFTKNLYSLFFIGANSSFPVHIFLLDENGYDKYEYHYEGLSFYSHIWNNPYQHIDQRNGYVIIYGHNTSSTPDRYTPYFNNSSLADISFGAFVPTSENPFERKKQVKEYLKKIRRYRNGLISFERRVLYSDTMWGNETVERDISRLPFYADNTPVTTSHPPSYNYHLIDDSWREAYLSNLEQQSYEIAWLNVHGAPTHHYFGVSSSDIENLPSLNTAYISLQSCSTGNYTIPGYLAGIYLNSGNVLAVEANMYPTMYVGNTKTPFSKNYNLHAAATGKKIGDAFRQHGSMIIGHVLYGDPMLKLGIQNNRRAQPSGKFWARVLPTIIENAKRTTAGRSAIQ